MAEYNIPQNRTNWVVADLVLAPAVYVIAWVLLVRFQSYNLYEYLASNSFMLQKIKESSVSGFAAHKWIDLYVLWYKGWIALAVGFVGFLLSFNEKIPGIGRQAYIPFRKWQINQIERTRSMKKLDRHENPLFPPEVRKNDPIYIQGAKDPRIAEGKAILLGFRKRFKPDIEADKRLKKRVEKLSDYEPLVMSKDSRFRHVLCVGGSGSGKTASIIGPFMWNDNMSSKNAVICMNPKGDEYLLRVAVDPVMLRRETPEFKKLEVEFMAAQREGETRSFAKWAMDVKRTSIKPFALISLSHPELSLQYDPLEYGDADQITKKIIYSADSMTNEFYKAQQETWTQSILLLIQSDDDLRGRLGLRHLHWFTIDPKTRVGDALSGVVDVDAEVKFPHMAERIRRQREFERLMSSGEKDAAEKLKEKGLLTTEELDKILKHDENRGRLRNIMAMPKENLAGLSSHISQLIEDPVISGIFTDSDRPSLNFREMMSCGGVIYIEVPTQSKAPQARAVARMLMMELQAYSADRDRGAEPKTCDIFAFIDEFGSLVYDEFINFIDKARSSRIGITLAHQSLGNLEKNHLSKSFRKEVLDNCATKFILSIVDVETQKYFKEVIGEAEVLRRSVSEADSRSTGDRSGSSRGVTRGFVETREQVVTESDLACKRGFGFARILEDDQSFRRSAISLGYLPESGLRSYSSVMSFLGKERLNHKVRPLPFYRFATDGQLWDPVNDEVVRAGGVHRGKPTQAPAPIVKPASPIEQAPTGPNAVEDDEPSEVLPAADRSGPYGDAALEEEPKPSNPRDFLLGGKP
ncbi:MAG: type IV secretory system conjugative DNA transfer family protein [Planctomycetes bacterium]|nr:type IV secretory system conjugative DNA transfer family protein [Planctomycetota bacterium]